MRPVPELSGQVFGRWTVLKDYILTPRGERKWACRCVCGTERYVLERTLKSGGSLSCGCLRKEQAQKSLAHDLAGKRFGNLTVIQKIEKESTNRGLWWECKCDCGNICEVLGTLLVTGRKTHCGCKTVRNQALANIKGQVFGRLTALYPTDQRSSKGSVLWHCKCSCGRELEVSYNDLMYSNVKSCGCQKKEHDQALNAGKYKNTEEQFHRMQRCVSDSGQVCCKNRISEKGLLPWYIHGNADCCRSPQGG